MTRRRIAPPPQRASPRSWRLRPTPPTDDLPTLRRGLLDLEDLVQNWKERTTNCNCAEVNETSWARRTSGPSEAGQRERGRGQRSAVKTLQARPEAVRRILGLDGKLNAKSAPLLARAPRGRSASARGPERGAGGRGPHDPQGPRVHERPRRLRRGEREVAPRGVGDRLGDVLEPQPGHRAVISTTRVVPRSSTRPCPCRRGEARARVVEATQQRRGELVWRFTVSDGRTARPFRRAASCARATAVVAGERARPPRRQIPRQGTRRARPSRPSPRRIRAGAGAGAAVAVPCVIHAGIVAHAPGRRRAPTARPAWYPVSSRRVSWPRGPAPAPAAIGGRGGAAWPGGR